MSIWISKYRILAYFALANVISWSVELPLVASAQGWLTVPIPFAIHYLAAFGPMLAAIIMTWVGDGPGGLKELFGRVTKWRVGLSGFFIGVLSPVALFAMAAIVVRTMGSEWPDLRLLGQVNYLPYLGIGVLVLWLATYGFGEEIGWRGYALPRLQNGRSALSATLILGAGWVLWHVPTFFYLETYLNMGLRAFPGFAVGVMLGAILLTWLYNSTNGSVLMVAVWHAVFDLLTASKAGQGSIAAIVSVTVMIWAIAIVIVFKPANLSRSEKHTL